MRPLERIQGQPVTGPGLVWCVQWHAESPDAFASCATRAGELHRSGKAHSPLSLLCGMAKRREDYRLPPESEPEQVPETPNELVVDEPDEEIPPTLLADRILEQRPGLVHWLRNSGRFYAESPGDFRAEISAAFGFRGDALVEEFRQRALEA